MFLNLNEYLLYLESLRMIRQARAPFIVALNKIDKPGSDVEIVKEQLQEEGVLLEDKGGDVQCVPISALKVIFLFMYSRKQIPKCCNFIL